MGKLVNALKNLGMALNGVEPQGKYTTDILNDIAKNYHGALEVESVEELTSEQCEALVVGQRVIKNNDGNKHAYVVSYKEDNVGMCLTYADCENVETIAYDCVEGEWQFNSKDVTHIGQ